MVNADRRNIDKIVISKVMHIGSTISLIFILVGLLAYIVCLSVGFKIQGSLAGIILIGLYILLFTPMVSLFILAIIYMRRHPIFAFFSLIGIASIFIVLMLLLVFR